MFQCWRSSKSKREAIADFEVGSESTKPSSWRVSLGYFLVVFLKSSVPSGQRIDPQWRVGLFCSPAISVAALAFSSLALLLYFCSFHCLLQSGAWLQVEARVKVKVEVMSAKGSSSSNSS